MSLLVRKCVFGLLLFSSLCANASMVDLMYLPKYGSFEVDFGYKYKTKTYNNRSTNSRIVVFEEDEDTSTIQTRATFSPFNELKIGVGLEYRISSTVEQKLTTSGSITKVETSGLVEPELFGQFRILKEKDFDFDVDGVLSLSPSFEMGEAADSRTKTSAKRGGGLYSGSLLIGKQWEDFSVRGHIKVDYNGERELEDVFTGLKSRVFDSSVDFSVGAFSQLKFAPEHGVEVGLEYINIGESKQTIVINNIEKKFDSYTILALTGGYKGEFVEDFFMGYINIQYRKISDHNVTTTTIVTENIDGNEKIITAGAVLKF